jgi:uncharacterized protein (DUF4415 family)
MKTKEGNIVRKTGFDPRNPPPIPPDVLAELVALESVPDEEIDYTNAPPAPADAVWKRVGLELPVHPAKKLISLRIDEDVVAFFKDTGKRYQTRINDVLRAYMQHHQTS